MSGDGHDFTEPKCTLKNFNLRGIHMTFHMPKVYIADVSYNVACMLAEITDTNWKLLTCPKVGTHDWLKFFHNIILRELYRDPRWTVPVHWAWRMPHTLAPRFEEARKILTPLVRRMIEKNVFRDPQPVYIGNKTYVVTNPDGSTFEMKVQ